MGAKTPTILLLGYGNPGRLDDGLGPALAALLEGQAGEGLSVDADYQLTVEHAYDLAGYPTVVFADAAMVGEAPYSCRPLEPLEPHSFTTHSLAPEAVLYLAQTLYQARPAAYLLGIRGYEFDLFRESLSAPAMRNLELARQFVIETFGPVAV